MEHVPFKQPGPLDSFAAGESWGWARHGRHMVRFGSPDFRPSALGVKRVRSASPQPRAKLLLKKSPKRLKVKSWRPIHFYGQSTFGGIYFKGGWCTLVQGLF